MALGREGSARIVTHEDKTSKNNDIDYVNQISKLLSDDDNIRILAATTFKGRSVRELALNFDIPIAVCYRKVNQLEKLGLIMLEDRILTEKGKRLSLYRSVLRRAELIYERTHMFLKIELDDLEPIKVAWNPLETGF